MSRDADGSIVVRPSPYARKDSGSFFTPQELVDLLFEHTLKPLVEEWRRLFEQKAAELSSDRRPKEQRKAELLKIDPAEAVLNLKILDPAMGSGHFLVTAVDFLSDAIADLIEQAPSGRQFKETRCAFFLHDTETIDDLERCFNFVPLTPADFARVNPNTGTAPVFRSRRDADICRRIYEHHPVLVDQRQEQRAWPVSYMKMFNMTNDSHLFRSAAQLDDEGFYPVAGNRWKRGDVLYLPLYQGRMIWQFDHRANSVRINPQSTHNPYLSEAVSEDQHADPSFLPQSQYWVPAAAVERHFPQSHGSSLGFRAITGSTNMRTCVAAIVPWAGAGNTLSLLVTDDPVAAACLLANLDAMCLDFVARCKMQSTSLNLYILEQFPVIASDTYARRFGPRYEVTAAELVRDHVLRLTYTSHDMAPFA